uniref:NADH dehydrogenase subunit 4L n=1 Tax=Ogataea parapolymorpha (strain ATCC 26012 / BCRC 20466 / JCM 22074 / NRRL Y-7560 / DL-1) TaxID=871575 RepID=E7E829_OGAPD|nr:NADH dehydrogenase subunit 4L [Ogataea polymorpha]ADT63560.1 NADH dehydrogenase subunit 4L [Ogataea polymorpha]
MEFILTILAVIGLNMIDIYIMTETLIIGCTIDNIWISSIDNDMVGTLYSLLQIIISGIESAIGLAMFVGYNKTRGSDDMLISL